MTLIKAELIENDLDETYVKITEDDGEVKRVTITPAEAVIVGLIIALQIEVCQIKKVKT